MDSRFNRLFVVTYGRSGSTLLQGLLNAIPGYRIYGENGGFLTKLHGAYEALVDANRHLAKPANDNHRHPWFGSSRYDRPTLNTQFHAFADGILFCPTAAPDVRVFGFKEIRYHDLGNEKLAAFLDFLRQIYPNSVIIFNTRRVEDVLRSGWWRQNYWHGLPKQFSDFAEFAGKYVEENTDHALHVRYDALVDPDRREVHRLLAFLGESLSDNKVNFVFRGSHSYENRILTEYISGRAAHIEMTEHDWWRANLDEFRLDAESRRATWLAKGVFLRAVGSDARVTLKSGSDVVQIVGTRPTPRIAEQYPNNPGSANAGFSLEQPLTDEIYLYGASKGFENRLVGIVRPRLSGGAVRVV
ncbi:MAG: sulfotransferase [Pseudomonadota bacterium]